jgi:C-terminal processing protease CtpA/Prc
MKKETAVMKEIWILIAAVTTLLLAPAALADGQADDAKAAAEAEYARVAENAEAARAEAEKARREAERVAEQAYAASRARAELERQKASLGAERSQEIARARAVRDKEVARAREDLSRAHRELREAQREVARAHRELGTSDRVVRTVRLANPGNRPVIGVVMGEETDQGVKLIGVSPDGPAEAAGVEVGDVITAINGVELVSADGGAKPEVFQVMEAAKAGDSIQIDVERDGKPMTFAVVAEVREPASWQSLVRIPEISTVERIEGGPGERRIVIESTVVPEIDEEALAERMEILKERLAEKEFYFHSEHFAPHAEGEYEFRIEEFSDMAGHAFNSANVWFGVPQGQGLELATINEGLGAYFKTDRGVLVLKAKESNAYQLEAGDVILKVGETEVDSPSDLMRTLREIEPGEEIEIAIKRDRRNKTLSVTMPENRFGFR